MAASSEQPKPDLVLIDGNSLAYRAFFALPESIATANGEPTNALFGFTSMLVRMFQDVGHIPTAVAWDAGLSGREVVYPEYKAQRDKKPDLLRQQWPHLAPIVEGFGYANVSLEGFEADDVIGTLAVQARERMLKTVIVTGDRDAFQLIDQAGLVTVMATARGITETNSYTWEAVIERYGLPPDLIPDFYGLKGDTSDNIPGVPGIGDKTASQLLQEFGDLDTVLNSVDKISGPKRKENLTNHRQDALTSRELARIQTDLPLSLDLDELLQSKPNPRQLRETFHRFELRDPWRRLEPLLSEFGDTGASSQAAVEVELHEVTLSDLPGLLAEFDQGVATPIGSIEDTLAEEADRQSGSVIENVSLAPVAVSTNEAAVEDGQLFQLQGSQLRFAVAPINSSGDPEKVFVGDCEGVSQLLAALGSRPLVCYDATELDRRAWLESNDIDSQRKLVVSHDVLLAAYLLEPQRRAYPQDELIDEAQIRTGIDDEAANAAVALAFLASQQKEKLDEASLTRTLQKIELPLIPVIRKMERAGVKLSVERISEVATEVSTEIKTLEQGIYDDIGHEFTIGSPQQLSHVLFEELGLSKKRKGKTGYSTDARVLQSIRHEHDVIPKIERWRELSTLTKTYLDVLPNLALQDPEHRIHTKLQQTVAQTGRLSSTEPNLQNVPVRTPLGKRIRGCFEAASGLELLSCDYSQVELRILAYYAGEQVLIDTFQEGGDVHTATASEVFGVAPDELTGAQRSKAKMINYGIAYGLTDFGLADRLNIQRSEAQEVIERYFERFSGVKTFIDDTIAKAKEDGFVTTMFGRRRMIPELQARNFQVRSLGERYAVNTVIQGTAADIMKLAMIRVDQLLANQQTDCRLLLTIHDELLLEGPRDQLEALKPLVEVEMCSPWKHKPALAVDSGIGKTWVEAK